MKGLHAFNSCFLHGDHIGDTCPHPEHRSGEGFPPRDWWRSTPCGHPQDPVAWLLPDGAHTCHCGCLLDPACAIDVDEVDDGPTDPIVYCGKCGCHVALPTANVIAEKVVH